MKTNRNRWLVAAAAIAIAVAYPCPAMAQTAAELMQKGIYTQETAGDLDGAIAIYRQIVNTGSSPRDLAAQAQYRLAQSLLQKGDLGNAATEFGNLARNYADYGKLVSNMAAIAHGAVSFSGYAGGGGRGGTIGPIDRVELERMVAERQAKLAELGSANARAADAAKMANMQQAKSQLAELQARLEKAAESGVGAVVAGLFDGVSFEGGAPVSVTGVVVEALWVNPTSVILLDPKDGSGRKYGFLTASPNMMLKQGWTRQTVKMNDHLTVTGVLSSDGRTVGAGALAAQATTITAADGRKIFDRAAIPK